MAVQHNMALWRESIQTWYPDYDAKTYFVPPVVITRLPLEEVTVAGQSVLVAQSLGAPDSSNSPSTTQSHAISCQSNSESRPYVSTEHLTTHQMSTVSLNHTEPSQTPDPSTKISSTPSNMVDKTLARSTLKHPSLPSDVARKTPAKSKLKHSSSPSIVAKKSPAKSNLTHSNPVRVQDCQTREDVSLQRVLFCLRKMAKEQKEVMFVISQLQFSAYLGNPCYAAAAKLFKRPVNMKDEFKQGDFDILIIHRHYGLLTGEIKSVQANQNAVDADIVDRIKKALCQLDKSKFVLGELTSDLESNLTIRKSLILPYVTMTDLQRILKLDQTLEQQLVTCLQASDVNQAIEWCLLADHLTANQNQWRVGQIQTWWKKRMADDNCSGMTEELYLDILARFCGPATTVTVFCIFPPRVEVRTEGESISMLGERMASIVLTPSQINLLNRAPQKVMMTGGPGVGKTLILVLMAIEWVKQGNDVNIVSVNVLSRAASVMIQHMILTTCSFLSREAAACKVRIHEYDFINKEDDMDQAVNKLAGVQENKKLYIVCDEFRGAVRFAAPYPNFVKDLCTRVPDIFFWAASPYHDQIPSELQEERMTIPLRSPPAVLEEVNKSFDSYSSQVYAYSTSSLASPCDGPEVKHMSHEGPKHTATWPVDCEECGQKLAEMLHNLGVGKPGRDSHNNMSSIPQSKMKWKPHAPVPLSYRDVFVLTRSKDLYDDVHETSRANGLVRGLRAKAVPVRVVREECSLNDVNDAAIAENDVVIVAYYVSVMGLERKVVVWLPHRRPTEDDSRTDDELDAVGRFHAMSRCTAQLVVVDVPERERYQLSCR